MALPDGTAAASLELILLWDKHDVPAPMRIAAVSQGLRDCKAWARMGTNDEEVRDYVAVHFDLKSGLPGHRLTIAKLLASWQEAQHLALMRITRLY